MRNKFYSKQSSKVSKHVIPICLIFSLIIAEGFLLFSFTGVVSNRLVRLSEDSRLSDEQGANIRANDISNSWERVDYLNLTLNNSVSFNLNATSTCKEIHFNFTSINETRDFINNGDFDSSSLNWDAINETDVNYTWTDNGVPNANCIGINLTGKDNKELQRPMNNSLGVENFRELDGWYSWNNRSANFTQGRDPDTGNPILSDTSGSLFHRYNATSSDGKANSTYQFFFNSSYPLYLINLSLWYYWQNIGAGLGNTIEIGIFINTPSNNSYLIEDWTKLIDNNSANFFRKKEFLNISQYFTETGYYNLTLYSLHQNLWDFDSIIYYDDIELNILYSYNEFNQNDSVFWNQNINFINRNVFLDGTLNFSYYITEKFDHINNSNVTISVWINNHRYIINNLTNIIANTWINESLDINKSNLEDHPINISIGLFFNVTSQIFINESFTIFFDNISLTLGTNPHPLEVELQIFSPDPLLNDTFIVDRDVYSNDFVNVSNSSFTWSSGQTHWLNLTSNSSNLIVNLTISYYISQDIEEDNGNGDGEPPISEPINVTVFIIILIIAMSITSFLFVARIQKRLFLNPKYDYIKKLKTKRRIDIKKERLAPVEAKRMCQFCRKPINIRAQFCEHCGQPQ